MISRLLGLTLILGLSLAAMLLELAPLGLSAGGPSAPDLVAAVVFCWALRRPAQTAPWLVFLIGLIRDLLAGGPVGAGALALVLGVEALRARAAPPPRFPVELLLFAGFAAFASLFVWLMMWISFAGAADLSALAGRIAVTIAVYPAVYALFRWVLRLKSGHFQRRRSAFG